MWIILLIAALAGLWLLREFANHIPRENSHWPVFARAPLTVREQFLYHRLSVMYPERIILAQVALSQIIDVSPGTSNRQAIRGKFKQLVADFVLCRSDFSIVAVIELDDPSHAQPHRQDADAHKTKAVESAGVTFVRIPAGPIPSETDLRRVIQSASRRHRRSPPHRRRCGWQTQRERSHVALCRWTSRYHCYHCSRLGPIFPIADDLSAQRCRCKIRGGHAAVGGQGTPMPEFRPAAAALAPLAMRPTAAEQEAEKQEKARAAARKAEISRPRRKLARINPQACSRCSH